MRRDKRRRASKRKQSGFKLFVIRKHIRARSAADAIRIEKRHEPTEVFIDDNWRQQQTDRLADAIGFMLDTPPADTDDEE